MAVEDAVARPGGVSFLRVPAKDPARAARFYRAVFGWTVDAKRAEPSFSDGTGHVIGHFVRDQAPAGEAGFRPYVFVRSVADSLVAVTSNGGAVLRAPYPEGELLIATFRDPEGNVVGLWQVSS